MLPDLPSLLKRSDWPCYHEFWRREKKNQPNAASEPCAEVVSIKAVSLFSQLSLSSFTCWGHSWHRLTGTARTSPGQRKSPSSSAFCGTVASSLLGEMIDELLNVTDTSLIAPRRSLEIWRLKQQLPGERGVIKPEWACPQWWPQESYLLSTSRQWLEQDNPRQSSWEWRLFHRSRPGRWAGPQTWGALWEGSKGSRENSGNLLGISKWHSSHTHS